MSGVYGLLVSPGLFLFLSSCLLLNFGHHAGFVSPLGCTGVRLSPPCVYPVWFFNAGYRTPCPQSSGHALPASFQGAQRGNYSPRITFLGSFFSAFVPRRQKTFRSFVRGPYEVFKPRLFFKPANSETLKLRGILRPQMRAAPGGLKSKTTYL